MELNRCYVCYRAKKACLCPFIETIDTKVTIVLLMHPKEAKKERLGTGRLAHACLPHSQIIIGVNFSKDSAVNGIIDDPHNACFLLYPGDKSIDLSNQALPPEKVQGRQLVVFLIDGTWATAKKIMRLSTNLHPLPRLSFKLQWRSRFSFKHQPGKYCLSTIECIYYLLDSLCRSPGYELNGKHRVLIKVLDELVNYQWKCMANPKPSGYRTRAFVPPLTRESPVREKGNRYYYG